MRAARAQRGFTLLEILVAFVVLALVGGALLEMFQGGLRNLATGDGYSRAALLAESTLSQLRAEPELAAGERGGELEPGYDYRLALAPYQDADQGKVYEDLLEADLTISWGEGGDRHRYRVHTLLLPPGGRR